MVVDLVGKLGSLLVFRTAPTGLRRLSRRPGMAFGEERGEAWRGVRREMRRRRVKSNGRLRKLARGDIVCDDLCLWGRFWREKESLGIRAY